MIIDENLKKTIESYQNSGLSNRKIAEKLNCNISYFSFIKRKLNIKNRSNFSYLRKFNVNDNFFSVPNDLNCYWAGFIAADGSITNNKLSIVISEKDLDLLKRFKKDIGAENEIKFYEQKLNNKKFKQCSIVIYSNQICEDLNFIFNITNKKTFSLKPPKIKKSNLIDYFIKGYIDGDGCVNKAKNNLTIHLTGTKSLLSWCNERFSEILNRKANSLSKRTKTEIYQTRYDCLSGRLLFKHYYNLEYGLERKWLKSLYEYCLNWKRKTKNNEG